MSLRSIIRNEDLRLASGDPLQERYHKITSGPVSDVDLASQEHLNREAQKVLEALRDFRGVLPPSLAEEFSALGTEVEQFVLRTPP